MAKDYDFVSGLLDEVALEGLDGITLEMLWQRLRDRSSFAIPVDEDSKIFFWKIVAMHKDLEIYELPKPRKFYPIYNRYDHIDPELGVVVEPEKLDPDPYAPVVPIKDGDVRGSCSTYDKRKCITAEIRHDNVLLISLKEAEDTWGDSLVLVASPKVRLISLIGTVTNPLIDLSLEAYCLLERIGRSRYLGEVTLGDGGLLSLKAFFCKQLHYYRKKLTSKGLVTKQNHYMKNKNGTTCTGSLFHLTRFYVQRKTKMATWMKCLCDILKDKPQNQESCKVLREEMKIPARTFRKLFYKPFEKWVKLVSLTCQEFYPDGTQKEWFTVNGEPKFVKVCQLLRHCDEEGDDKDDDDDEANDNKAEILPANIHFDSSKIYYGIPLVHQLYGHIKDAGPEGVSAGDLGRTMTLPRLDIRGLLTLLSRKGHIISVLQDRGRQKVKKYIAKIYGDQNTDYSSLKDQDILSKKPVQVNGESVNHISGKRKDSDAEDAYNAASATKRTRIDQENVPPPYADTDKKRERSSMILEYIKSERLTTLSKLNKHIMEKEKRDGYSYKLDKRSTARLVNSLHNYKKIKIFKGIIKLEDEQTEIEFICDNSVDKSDPLLQASIEDIKFKKFCVPKMTSNKTPHANKQESCSSVPNSSSAASPNKSAPGKEISAKRPATKLPTEGIVKYPRMTPKFLRAKALHSFLFYLVYKHKGNPGNNEEQVIYHDTLNWRRFVPPLLERIGEGWVYLSDIYSRMPLSLFVKIVHFNHGFPGLNQYLENEEKLHYLLKFLPQNLRNNLLNNRRFLFSTNEVIKILCYLGLVSLGPSAGKQKDQLFLYVHKHASIKDTTISPSGYVHIKKDMNYEVKTYTFESEDDIETFWLDLENIAFHTSLGKFSAAAGKTIRITEADYKPELISATKSKQFNEVVDDGNIPGDGLGAGGFDSSLYLHWRRNWLNTAITEPHRNSQKPCPKRDSALASIQNLLKRNDKPSTEPRTRLQRLTKNTLLMQKDNKLAVNKSSDNEKVVVSAAKFPKMRERTKIRTVKMRHTKKRAPYYDENDKAAIMKMDKARCTWTSQEDSFLLLCKVASSFLDPHYCKNSVVPYTVVRDLLYKQVPEISENKTSRACQRRLRYMMLNPETINNVNVFLGEALQDDELVKEFNVPKPPKTNEEVWASMFTTVVKKLLEKFTSSASERCKNFVLPRSRGELEKHYELKSYYKTNQNYKDLYKVPKSVEDIRKFVLSSLILSAMAVTDEIEWPYLLHKLYQCFPDNYISSAVNSLRKAGILAVKRRTCKTDLKRSLQSSCPYKFSANYSNAMLTKFPVKIFKEAETLYNKLKSLEPGADEELVGYIPPGFSAAVLSLMQTKQLYIETRIPSQIMLFDSSLSKEARSNIVERMINTLSDKESTELSRLLKEVSIPTAAVKNNEYTAKEQTAVVCESIHDDMSITGDLSLMDNSQMSEVRRFASASRFALYLLRQEMSQPPKERVQHAQDYIVLNSCSIVCHLEPKCDIPDLPIIPADIIENSSDQDTLKTSKEAVCITKDKMLLTNDKIAEISQQLVQFIPSNIFLPNQNYVNQIEAVYKNYASNVLLDAKCVFDTIYSSGVVGITEKEIWKKFRVLSGNITVLEHLDIFRKSGLTVRAGIVEFNYVCGCFAKNYVLPTFHSFHLPTKSKKNNADCPKVPGSVSENSITTVLSYSETNFESNDVQSTEADQSMYTDGTADDEEKQISPNVSRSNLPSSTKTETLYFIPRTWRKQTYFFQFAVHCVESYNQHAWYFILSSL
ncbi:General transcription factor 3C polypeptide 1 [Araneus ventricosus]|uniref:General transcription factor 3C polypeptide 1 n=1 Tax=Araneus ventricosus TaxID=182803 RepID=A0A4Y2GBY7_ARAVE|nr:General transcription factor 3C polypeptide 1 [Araneus ventricosus]